ncbi:hypothetical protein KP509_39G021500 [Ceratopteris richardii]|uniref:galactinol--sucrose galactosyltransferase n=1 Tax=Ceratopteris richardii TaxID=49495 RepID=A0A8T2PZJ9_CERRI|nr:hypothetical protein KP509_39G021500 [Ceratopteris richardii]
MTILSGIKLYDRKLMLERKAILTDVPKNVVLTPSTGMVSPGIFLGAFSPSRSSRHVFSLGVLRDVRFMCCFRFNLWWMTQRMGMFGRDLPAETQFLLVETIDDSMNPEVDAQDAKTVYTVFLPLIDGPFRASLQGNEDDEIELCLESGDESVSTAGAYHSVFVYSGKDPFQVVSDAVKRRETKQMPGILDSFGWCTWDAFYTDVSPEGIQEGLRSLDEGGIRTKFLLIDDGWLSAASDTEEGHGEIHFKRRLVNVKENQMFRQEGKNTDLGHLIKSIKQTYSVKYVYVWHALAGYWGGVHPNGKETRHYESSVMFPKSSPGVEGHQIDIALEMMATNGVGLVNPNKVFQFYNDLHGRLAEAGVDGVKVDVQNILETVGAGFGGRVSLTRQYHKALESSISSNFPDNGCIACMSHNTDGLYSINQTAVVRASDDFWPRDPASHTIHIASVSYNSIFLGEFMQPDWDMFQSLHPAAEYHAAARAVGGCPIYVSDKPGQHDFKLLKKLVLPDGSILRAKLPGRPTRDSLFTDPARDGKSLLKIWNLNACTGVLGVFNCQGAGWCKQSKVNVIHTANPPPIIGVIRVHDVDWLHKIASENWDNSCAVFSHREGSLNCLNKNDALPVTLKVLEYEVFTISPILRLSSLVRFAPLGLYQMFNSGGAIVSVTYRLSTLSCEGAEDRDLTVNLSSSERSTPPVATVIVRVRGCGECGFYSSVRPKECRIGSQKIDFTYNPLNGLVSVLLLSCVENLTQEVQIVV